MVSGLGARTMAAEDHWSEETSDQRAARMKWWQQSRFGMFIHWGLYAVPAGQWKEDTHHAEWIRTTARIPIEQYDGFVAQFNPTKFDADQWARMAKRAGMKYLVITSKHHDGFCLWPSKLTDYDMDSTPSKCDIMGELSRACKEQGIRFCMYHSIMDWHHPDYLPRRDWEQASRSAAGADFDRYVTYMNGQLKELVERYDPGVLWFDGEWEDTWNHERGKQLYQYVRSLSPDIIINNRVDKGRRGMEGLTEKGEFRGDFGTPEQQIPATGIPGSDWETCMTMNDHWGWNKHDKNWKSTKDLIHNLVDIASKGGNFLLNIGPKADGTFPQEAIDRLEAMGQWMDVNGSSIYGTQASPTRRPSWGRITRTTLEGGDTRLFLHVFEWPADGKLEVAVSNASKRCALLADERRQFEVASGEEGLTVALTGPAPDPICSVVALDIRDAPVAIGHAIRQAADGSVTLKAADAEVHNPGEGQSARYESGGTKDNIGFWLNPQSWVEWTFRISKPNAFDVAAEVGSQSDGVKFQVVVGKETLEGAAPNTGNWDTYINMSLGRTTLDKPGTYRLEVRPVKENWKPINLRSITLMPINP
ncbi:MAG: alpha-L-fucosidase [Planctomycetes bacterium]|nr:alpha-L-fucosidase [Planctomycetota bacterium]